MNPAKLLLSAPLTLSALALATATAAAAPARQKAAPRAPTSSAERAATSSATIARATVRGTPEAFWVCLRSPDATRPVWCLSLAALQRRAPADVAKIDAAIAEGVGQWATGRSDLLTGADVHGALAGVDLGCTGKRSSITLEASDQTGVLSAAPVRDCSSATSSSLGSGLAGLDVAQSDAWDMTTDYVDALVSCKQARRAAAGGGRGRGPGPGSAADCGLASGCDGTGKADNVAVEKPKSDSIKTSIGRVWEKVVDAFGGDDGEDPPANAVTGTRGYCFADAPCGQGSCEAEASAHALREAVREDKTQTCDPVAMPDPEGSACLATKPVAKWTQADTEAAFTRVCELRQRVASSREGTMRCVQRPATGTRDLDPCRSNVGMCSEEQGGRVRPSGRTTGGPSLPRSR